MIYHFSHVVDNVVYFLALLQRIRSTWWLCFLEKDWGLDVGGWGALVDEWSSEEDCGEVGEEEEETCLLEYRLPMSGYEDWRRQFPTPV